MTNAHHLIDLLTMSLMNMQGLILVLVALGVGIVLGLPYFNRLRNEGALDSILGTKIKHRA